MVLAGTMRSYWHSFLLLVCAVHTSKEAHAIATCSCFVGRLYVSPIFVMTNFDDTGTFPCRTGIGGIMGSL